MDEHRSSKMRTEQAQPISNLTNNRSPDCSPSEIDIEQGEDSALPEQAIYVPQELILSDELSRELGQSRKKGPRAKLMEELRVFLEEYKITGRQKPGKGNHYKSLVGPNGQRIWRFSISYQNRCLAVEVDDGKAIIVFVGDHDFVYGNNKRALLKIRKALTQLND